MNVFKLYWSLSVKNVNSVLSFCAIFSLNSINPYTVAGFKGKQPSNKTFLTLSTLAKGKNSISL